MEARAPAVVAVVVSTGPAPGLESTLSTLVAQDYEELSVLVVASSADSDLPARVAAVAPHAFVKILDENRGFAAACNEAVLMVQGATFLLFCHDDVLIFDGAVRQLVEASFRANAGIVTPKVVAYEDAYVLLHVGQIVDRFGTVRERVERGEIDHGQQDVERDVFVAPGGVTLVRTDLFETLHGFDPLIPAFGEDLDLCWRAQVAGARVLIAPAAVVAHRETLATGERPVTAVGTRGATVADLKRRHQLTTVLTCWSRHSLLSVIPGLVLLEIAEMAVALMGRDSDRVGAIAGAWRWVWHHRREIRQRRRALGAIRVLKDADITRLQIGGASRLRTFATTLFQDGLSQARGLLPELEPLDGEEIGVTSLGFAAAFGDDDNVEDIAALDTSNRRHRLGRLFSGARSQAVVIALVAVVWLYGVRNLVATPLPIVGRLAPLESWWSTWRHFFGSWSPSGVGTATPGPPGYGVLGVAGTFVVGRMGILPRLVLIYAAPVGAWGVWRLLRGVVSNRSRLVGAIAYLAFPVAANLIEGGRLDDLVVVALLPFAVRRILLLLNIEGFRREPLATGIAFGHRGWGRTRPGHTATLLLEVALMTAMAPAALVAVELVIAGLTLAQTLAPRRGDRLDRPWALAGHVLLGTAFLLIPLTFDTLVAGTRAPSVFGLEVGTWSSLTLGQLLRGANGSFGYGWGGWVLPLIVVAAVVLARDVRQRYVVKFLSVVVVTALLAVLVGRNWLGAFAPDVNVLLVLVGVMTAVLAAIAMNAVENDRVVTHWRHQLVSAVTVALLIVGALPLLAQSASGRFNLPMTGTPETLGSLGPSSLGGYRVLWLGQPDVLPVAGWSVAPGLAAATTTNALPNGATLLAPPDPGTMTVVLRAVNETLRGQTVRLGQLLAPFGFSTVVVMASAAPSLNGLQTLQAAPPPANLIPALKRQSDLAITAHSPGVTVFANSLFHGLIAERTAPLASTTTSADDSGALGWRPVLHAGSATGVVSAGTVLAGVAPASAFALVVNGHAVERHVALGGAAVFSTPAGRAALVLRNLPLNAALALVTLGMWGMLLLGFGGLERVRRRVRGSRDNERPSPRRVDGAPS